jgi:hypothetical protein
VSFNRRFRMRSGFTMTHPGVGNPDILGPAGGIDPQVGVLGAWNAAGDCLGVVVNFACHATTGPPGISADYVEHVERTIRGALGDGCIVVFTAGMAGDVTQVDNRNPYAYPQFGNVAARRLGSAVGAAAATALLGLEPSAAPLIPLAARSKTLEIPRRAPQPARLSRALTLVQSGPEVKVDPTEWTFAKELVLLDARLKREPVAPVEVQAIQVGPAVFLSCPAEYFVDYGLELKVLERSDCEALGMGSYLAVSQGSDLPPKFIHLTYRPSGPATRRLVLVGKGLSFDSGGYNLKTAGSQIEMMKYDMGGSAAVLGAMRAIAELKPEGVEVHMLVAACENMISGGAIHPGAIVTASNGKTIEINNTDAEGRLTLADALVYACKLEPDAVVDLATLTGACVIALGEEIAGLWSSSDGLADALLRSARAGGEELWRMPMRSSYRDGLKSHLADLKNTGPRPGGSITAALFLQEFVSKDLAWAHLDIAGTVWSDKGRGVDPAGATGFGVRTLVAWVCSGAAA